MTVDMIDTTEEVIGEDTTGDTTEEATEATTEATTEAMTEEATEAIPRVTWTAAVTLLVTQTAVDTLPDETTNLGTGARLVDLSGTTTDREAEAAVDTTIDGVGIRMIAGTGEAMTRGPTRDLWLKPLFECWRAQCKLLQ